MWEVKEIENSKMVLILLAWLPGQQGMPLANGDNGRDAVGCGWKATRWALDVFHVKISSRDGADDQKREPRACGEKFGQHPIPVVLVALVCMRFL